MLDGKAIFAAELVFRTALFVPTKAALVTNAKRGQALSWAARYIASIALGGASIVAESNWGFPRNWHRFCGEQLT